MIITVWHVGVRFCIWSAVISEFLSVKLSDSTMPLWHLKRLMAQIKASALCHIISAHHTQHVAVTHLQEYAKLLHNSYWTKIKFRSLTKFCVLSYLLTLCLQGSVSPVAVRGTSPSPTKDLHIPGMHWWGAAGGGNGDGEGGVLLGSLLWHCECQTPITLIRARICMIKRIRDFNQKNSLVWKRDTLRQARLTLPSPLHQPPVSPPPPPRSEHTMNMHGPATRWVAH